MKKIILSLTVLGFVAAVQAADKPEAAPADKPACCSKAKVATGDKAECPMMAKQEKAAACKAKEVAKQNLQSPKGSEQAKR